MDHCIHSLLPAGDDIEILIVDDGSVKDRTAEIADQYAAAYPDIIKAIHQENGGHGEAVNTGIKNASGLYFKVIDSDDWADTEVLCRIVKKLKEMELAGTPVDMFLANFIYDKVGAKKKKIMHFRHAFPTDEIFSWQDIHHMKTTQYILMHNIIYRHDVLVESGLQLPAHTFYVDNIFAFQPYPYVRSIYYMDENLYHYYIGREDQSVNEQVMIGRIDQQIKVNQIMIDIMAETDFKTAAPRVKKIMYNYLDKIMCVTSALLLVDGSSESLKKKKEIWKYLRRKSLPMFLHLRLTPLGLCVNVPGKLGRKASVRGYKIAKRLVGFN